MFGLDPYYARLLENSPYCSVEEMCNALGLNLDEVYNYEGETDRDGDGSRFFEDEDGWHWDSVEGGWVVDGTDE